MSWKAILRHSRSLQSASAFSRVILPTSAVTVRPMIVSY